MTDGNADLKLSAGLEVMVQLEGLPQRLKTSVMGVEKDQYLILKTPNVAGFSQYLHAGVKMKISYLADGNVYGFQAIVLNPIQVQRKLIFLFYPGRVERVELRQDPRIDCYLPGLLTARETTAKGFVTNISPGGCRFAGRTDDLRLLILSEGAAMEISFQFIGLEGNQIAQGTVRSIQQGATYTVIGIQFKGNDTALTNKIRAYVNEVLEYSSAIPR